ncbi:hypothetical protein MGYG_07050 [Nannizzia gypsea CBS 118893]|uniref:ATP-grasp domain-containing protein n=1 Tax=Arthroderma gypseum (strain ATCC MYA-4604 / CBS 118893) TaxID=535722 RepID=E4V1X9_ARTGP|nr:hypothetical protein MGYG_07050 [Nannizzia gypsea CBS 118893]EFR04044.1 hypothetical protein MGYG_07050 [Nannizzia gypsea CBS 118893]
MATHQRIQVRSKKDESLVLDCSWSIIRSPPVGSTWQSVDIVFCHLASSGRNIPLETLDHVSLLSIDSANPFQEILSESLSSTKALQFILQCLLTAASSAHGHRCLAKLVIPLREGYIVRSDIIPLRLRDCPHVEAAVSFAEPLCTFKGTAALAGDKGSNLLELFSAAAAGLILNPSLDYDYDMGVEAVSSAVESELENRLSLPWILPGTPSRKTLVLVDANTDHPDRGGTGSGFYLAAIETGVNVVVMDNAGHWLQESDYAHWREAFIPTRLTNPVEEDLADHITKSLKAYGKPVDGIVTFADTYWPYIAKVAQQFGLPTCPPEGFKIATNKYLTSKFVGHNAHHACSADEAFGIASKHDLTYPLIVKPCDGWSSEGVSRVDSPEALALAIKSIDVSRHGTEFVIEPYCSGPEFDANFILLDGEVLFSEICDDLPKSADINSSSERMITNFHELNTVYPSALPSHEKNEIRQNFLNVLLKLGLRTGIMHLEGRVENSSVEYTSRDGVLELTPVNDKPTAQPPKPWLIEINPRPPGMTASQITESTYGVEYWGVAVLSAVGDKARVRALSQPFKHGSQYTSVMVFIPADFPSTAEGIFDSDDICKDLIVRRPDLARNISRGSCFIKRGQKVPHPSSGQNTFMAYFNVFSRSGRKEALEIARQVREEVRYSFI